jgi:hypothetical protein
MKVKNRKKLNRNIVKYIAVITFFGFILTTSCASKSKTATKRDYPSLELSKAHNDSTEYEILITDPGYESFLAVQKPIDFYSQRYYESWNIYYVTDWNLKVRESIYHSPKYQNIFDMYIDYNSNIDYGIDVNYKLYYYFIFVEKRYGVRFNVPRAINY